MKDTIYKKNKNILLFNIYMDYKLTYLNQDGGRRKLNKNILNKFIRINTTYTDW